jgi:ribosomal protein L37E
VRVSEDAAAGSLLGQLRARICADCGYAELRAENALDLYLAHQSKLGRAGAPVATDPHDTPTAAANIQCPSCGSVIHAAAKACEACGWSIS